MHGRFLAVVPTGDDEDIRHGHGSDPLPLMARICSLCFSVVLPTTLDGVAEMARSAALRLPCDAEPAEPDT
jgi:hypothetical protein